MTKADMEVLLKDICLEKRQKALEDKKTREAKTNRRQNILNNTVNFLDDFGTDDKQEDERAMVCVNEEDAEEYDKYDDDPYYM